MRSSSPQSITQLLVDWSNGDQAALNQLMPLVYQELRRMARRYMRNERAGHTWRTTDLVHEAYVRLTRYEEIKWQERAHFFAIAATEMRRVLVDHAKAKARAKRGGNVLTISLDSETLTLADPASARADHFLNLLALDRAITELGRLAPRKAKVVDMRVFGGMKNEEIATALSISVNQTIRDWNFARAFLARELTA